ncbi:hypothetical protein YPPY100_0636 [Yersinia pestis PY-100]|nr:hypothetical protein YPPY100_0636 [Yersinia pestis PY-100]
MYLRRLYDLPVLSVARLEPTWMYLRRLYDLPVLSVAGTLSITSDIFIDAKERLYFKELLMCYHHQPDSI